MNRTLNLKIKIKSLAAEAVIIRDDERRLKRVSRHGARWNTFGPDENRHPANQRRFEAYRDIRQHRTLAVRAEARYSLLAYGFIRGRAYKAIEAKCHEPPFWMSVARMVKRFSSDRVVRGMSDQQALELVKGWADGAQPMAAMAAE